MWFREKKIEPTSLKRIGINKLLRGHDKEIELEKMIALWGFYKLASNSAEGGSAATNIASVTEKQIKDIHSIFGPSGLFKLVFLANAHNEFDFNHFFRPVAASLKLLDLGYDKDIIECDNSQLLQSNKLLEFNSNVLLPSLSRKLFNPGRHEGYMVYGFGEPRILVSHQFRGIEGDLYDIYNNTVDVVTSLMHRGYVGTFLFLDNLLGLNFDVKGVPAWLAWFSMIATHSDIVLFITNEHGEFRDAQKKEVEFTSDRVQKKIVVIPEAELSWAKQPESVNVNGDFYVGKHGSTTREEFYKQETEHASPFIEQYSQGGFPRDRIIQITESGEIFEFPLNYNLYNA